MQLCAAPIVLAAATWPAATRALHFAMVDHRLATPTAIVTAEMLWSVIKLAYETAKFGHASTAIVLHLAKWIHQHAAKQPVATMAASAQQTRAKPTEAVRTRLIQIALSATMAHAALVKPATAVPGIACLAPLEGHDAETTSAMPTGGKIAAIVQKIATELRAAKRGTDTAAGTTHPAQTPGVRTAKFHAQPRQIQPVSTAAAMVLAKLASNHHSIVQLIVMDHRHHRHRRRHRRHRRHRRQRPHHLRRRARRNGENAVAVSFAAKEGAKEANADNAHKLRDRSKALGDLGDKTCSSS